MHAVELATSSKWITGRWRSNTCADYSLSTPNARRSKPSTQVRLAKFTHFPGRLPVFYHFYPFLTLLPVFRIPISQIFFCIFTVKHWHRIWTFCVFYNGNSSSESIPASGCRCLIVLAYRCLSSATLHTVVIELNISAMSSFCDGFPLLLFSATIPCIIVFSKPLWRVR